MATAKVPDANNDAACNKQVPEWMLASQGIKLLINNNGVAAEKLFLQYPDSLVMYAGYSFAVFMDGLMTFEEDKLSVAIATLKEVEKRCATENGWLKSFTSKVFGSTDLRPPQSLADQLETQIILADSQVCIAILTFLQQDISGYFKGGWVLRKAWKVYQRAYKEILQLYQDNIGELHLPDPGHVCLSPTSEDSEKDPATDWDVPETQINGYIPHKIPHSHSAYLHEQSNGSNSFGSNKNSFLKKSNSINSALSSHSTGGAQSLWSSKFNSFNSSLSLSFTNSIHLFASQSDRLKHQDVDKETIIRLMSAVSFGYGLFQLGISLLPPSLMKLINILGFGANRQNGIACLMYARKGVDMRAPLATLSLLWYHTIVRPFYAIDGCNVQAGADASTQLLQESEEEFSESALFLFFKGRVCRLNSDIPSALKAFQQSVENASQREIKILSLHEVAWCHIIELDFIQAQSTLLYLRSSSRWSRAFYTYLATICVGACGNVADLSIFDELKTCIQNAPRGGQLDEFLNRRSKRCPSGADTIAKTGTIYWKLFLYEMLYLWNALPSCSFDNINKVLQECEQVSRETDEPMVGLSKLIAGSCCFILREHTKAIDFFRQCLASRAGSPADADDVHVTAFALYELGALLTRTPETKEEGRLLLVQATQLSHYDFDQRLNLRLHSLLKHL